MGEIYCKICLCQRIEVSCKKEDVPTLLGHRILLLRVIELKGSGEKNRGVLIEMGASMTNLSTILIIDDSISSCFYMAQALEGAGYHVITASDGREGLKKVLQERLQCLVLDVVLPGMSGFELCRQLRKKYFLRSLPIIMVSSKDTPLDRSWGLRQGANSYLVKPFTGEELVHTVKEILPERTPVVSSTGVHSSIRADHLFERKERVPPLQVLIPLRCEDADPMWAGNSQPPVILDRQVRLVYAVIDGRKNVEKLCEFIRMDREEVVRALRIMLSQHRIQLYEPGGRLVDGSRIFLDH